MKSSDVNYIESEGDYLKLHRDEDCLVIHDTLKSFQTKLPDNVFLRVHRSYIVNFNKIEYFEGNQVCIGSKIIPVASSYRKEIRDLVEKSN
ncbi:LytTR family DNA-binding domain-containing protein [Labilibaculum sp. K2S]|nr:LytTR family DNA-binding domain-containing protein [Labilibaculum sp. K2S]MDM8158805.1 LytTR family DNA-binding domain-containing protein [Labilibaculum sp. K2S]